MFWVRLTQQQDEKRFGSDDGLALAMARFYSNPESRKVVKMVESGLLVAVEALTIIEQQEVHQHDVHQPNIEQQDVEQQGH